MASFDDGDLTIHFDDEGRADGFPVLLIAPGGMRSENEKWTATPWNPRQALVADHRVIGMDQRNAGRSSGPVSGDHGWHTYRDDQLALLDHLGVDRCHLVGMCIGGPYIINLLRAQPERFASAVLLQPVGIDDNRQEFYDLFDLWAEELAPNFFRDVTADEWHSFRSNMWDGEFVLTATPDEVAAIETPMLIAMGNDVYHPEATSRRIAELAPNARLIEEWKEGEALAAIDHAIHDFLAAHTA